MKKDRALNLLGLPSNASWEEVKKGYRRLALESHPDRHPDDPQAAERFRRATEAYEDLARFYPPEVRRRQAVPGRRGEVPAGPEPLDDIFAEIFEWERRRHEIRGQDWEVMADVGPQAAVRGCSVTVKIPFEEVCRTCQGRGAPPGTSLLLCRFCFGRGVVGREEKMGACGRCFGRGTVPRTQCASCRGSGRKKGERTRRVEIPAGLKEGEILKCAGEGGLGWHGGVAGDLYVRIALRTEPSFSRSGGWIVRAQRLGRDLGQWVRRWIVSSLVVAAVLPLVSGCAGRQVRRYQSDVTADMRSSYNRAVAEYNARRMETAENLLMSYVSEFPYNRLTDEAFYKLGEIHFGREDYSNALWYYRKATSRVYLPTLGPQAAFKEAISLHRLGRRAKAMEALDRIPKGYLKGGLAVRVYSFWVKLDREEGESPAGSYLGLYNTYQAWGSQGAPPAAPWLISQVDAEHWLEAWATAPLDEGPGPVKKLEKQFRKTLAAVFPRMKLALHWWDERSAKKARPLLISVVEDYPVHPFAEKAKAILKQMGGDVVLKKRQVGILLPLTGSSAVYGEALLHGIECAAGIKPPCESSVSVHLVVENSGETSESARFAAERLAGAGVSVIIGPMLAATIDGAATVATERQVPMVVVSKRTGVARSRDFLYQNFLTPKAQVREVVTWLARQGSRRFAILYPASEVGKEFAAVFEEEVQNLKGEQVGSFPYDPEDPAPVDVIEKIAKTKPPPQVLFIPDNYREVGQIAALLADEGVKGLRLAGMAAWNHPELGQKAGRYLEGAVFTDGFYVDSADPVIQKFAVQFETAYGAKPGTLEAYGYDTLLLVMKALEASGTGKPADVAEALNRRLKARGLSGWMEVDETGTVNRDLFLFEIRHGAVQEIHR